MNVNSVPKNICIVSFICVVKSFKCKYHLNVFERAIILHMLRMGLGRGWVKIL